MRAYRIAYDGQPYRGFQRQPDVPTVEGAIFDAFRALDAFEPAGATADRPAGYAAAGRTDAGVSALAQTVAFEAPDWLTPAALNGELPADVRAWASADAPPEFHATHDAASRTYVYHLHAPRDTFDDEDARNALERLTGEHDVHNLTPDEAGTVRDLSGSLRRDEEYLVVRLRAGGFARQLVRRFVTLVAEIGRGERARTSVERVLSPEPLDGAAGVGPATPEPLVLADVTYPDLSFAVDERAAASARTVFHDRAVQRRTGARVAAAVRDGLGGDRADAGGDDA
jgi:tRNA pseudouridine38-40 synthase